LPPIAHIREICSNVKNKSAVLVFTSKGFEKMLITFISKYTY